MQLTEKLARLQDRSGADEAAQHNADIALLRAEVLRLTDEHKRLQNTPKARPQPELPAFHPEVVSRSMQVPLLL